MAERISTEKRKKTQSQLFCSIFLFDFSFNFAVLRWLRKKKDGHEGRPLFGKFGGRGPGPEILDLENVVDLDWGQGL